MQSRKEVITLTAARLFRKKGYKATSMKDIAEEIGIKAASIYNHINSKQELLSEMLLKMATLFSKGMNDIYTMPSLGAEGKLERLIALHTRLTTEHTDAVALITNEWVHLETPAKEEYIALRDQYEDYFRSIIVEGKKEGVFKDLDTEIILFSTLSTLRWLYSWYSKNRQFNIIELEVQITQCLVTGIKS